MPIGQDFSLAYPLNTSVAGAGPEQRIGRKIVMKSLMFRYAYQPSSAATSQIRILIVYDKQTNGVLATPENILTGTSTTNPPNINSLMDLSNSERFSVIADVYSPQPVVTGGVVVGSFYRKFNLDTIYETGTNPGQIADIKSGSILVLCAEGDSTTGTMYFTSRIRFVDN